MAMPSKNPPTNIREIIEQYVAGEGGSTVLLGRIIGVSDSTVRKWFKEDESLQSAYEGAREHYFHGLFKELREMCKTGKGNVAGIIYTLKAKGKFYDMPGNGKVVDVNVNNIQPVMIVKDKGTDEQWAAGAARQQRELLAACTTTPQLEAPQPAQIDAVALLEPPAYVPPTHGPASAPAAPAWVYPGPPVWHGNG